MNHQSTPFENRMRGSALSYTLREFTTLDSTSDTLKNLAAEGAPEGTIVLANAQTRGRGRYGKTWLSLPGMGLYFSALFRPNWSPSDALMAGMMASLAVARALELAGMKGVELKWPNDILINGRKIAGVLAETRLAGGRTEFVVIGIGINLDHTASMLESCCATKATSCRIEGLEIKRLDLLARILDEMERGYLLIRAGGRNTIIDEWHARGTLRAEP